MLSWIEWFWGPALLLDAIFVYVALRRQGIRLSDIPEAIWIGLRGLWKRVASNHNDH